MSTVWFSPCRKVLYLSLGVPLCAGRVLKTQPGPQATFLGVVTPANRTSDQVEEMMGRTAKGRLQGHRAASSNVPVSAGRAPISLTSGRRRQPGDGSYVWQPPFVRCGWEPQASKCRRSNPAPFQYAFQGPAFETCGVSPFLLRQIID